MYVYLFVESNKQVFKIGRAKDVWVRFDQLSKVYEYDINKSMFIKTDYAVYVEKLLLEMFDSFKWPVDEGERRSGDRERLCIECIDYVIEWLKKNEEDFGGNKLSSLPERSGSIINKCTRLNKYYRGRAVSNRKTKQSSDLGLWLSITPDRSLTGGVLYNHIEHRDHLVYLKTESHIYSSIIYDVYKILYRKLINNTEYSTAEHGDTIRTVMFADDTRINESQTIWFIGMHTDYQASLETAIQILGKEQSAEFKLLRDDLKAILKWLNRLPRITPSVVYDSLSATGLLIPYDLLTEKSAEDQMRNIEEAARSYEESDFSISLSVDVMPTVLYGWLYSYYENWLKNRKFTLQ